MSHINIGLFGFGVVGEGIYNVLSKKTQLGAQIKKVVIKHPEKKRNAPDCLFSTNANDILNDDSIDLVVELIDNAEDAFTIVTKALQSKKSVVSANKKMIAEHHLELIKLSRQNNVSFLYEAAVCGSIPIIRNLEEYFDNDLLNSVQGIVNGSTNYILSKMFHEQETYASALKVAQENGFAESNPCLDVEGFDAANKLSIIALHAFGKRVSTDKILRKGITSIHPFDLQYAQEKKCVIKLIAKATADDRGEISELSIMPAFVAESDALGQTNNEYNSVLLGSALSDQQFFYGKGAGRYPTASAVLSDISAYKYGYKYEYKKGLSEAVFEYKASGKYYIGFDKNTIVDKSIFDVLEEHFEGTQRAYLTGIIAHKKLIASELLTQPGVSVISYN